MAVNQRAASQAQVDYSKTSIFPKPNRHGLEHSTDVVNRMNLI
jgi:hypothetical protein